MAGRIATQEELLALMMELQNEMPAGPQATYSPEELQEFAVQSADEHRQYMLDNVWMLGLPHVARQAQTVGGAIHDGVQRVRNSSNIAKDWIWPRRLKNLDVYEDYGALVGFSGLTETARGNIPEVGREINERSDAAMRNLLNMVQDLFRR